MIEFTLWETIDIDPLPFYKQFDSVDFGFKALSV